LSLCIDSGGFLQEIDGKTENASGLITPSNWGSSTSLGHIELSAGPRLDIPVGGPWFVLSAKGDLRWNSHDSSFTLDGTATLDVPAGAPAAFFRASYSAPGVTKIEALLAQQPQHFPGRPLAAPDGPTPGRKVADELTREVDPAGRPPGRSG